MMKNPFKVMIITCWILLSLCLIVKLFGLNWFEPIITNGHFKDFCDYIDENLWIKYSLFSLYAAISYSLYVLAVLKQRFYTKIQFLIYIPLIIGSSLVSWYFNWLKWILDIVIVLLPFAFKANWKRILIGILLVLIFEAISIITKNIGQWNINSISSFVALILQVDTIIMLGLYYLYSNNYRKE